MLQSGLLLAVAWTLYFCSTDHSLGSRNLSFKRFGSGVLDTESSCPSHNMSGRHLSSHFFIWLRKGKFLAFLTLNRKQAAAEIC